MIASTTVPVKRFLNIQRAHMARGILETYGIQCSVTGDQLASTLSYYGMAVNRVELWVKEGDVNEALAILDELNPENDLELGDQQGWLCSGCEEVNEPAFDECWSCSLARAADVVRVPLEDRLPPPRFSPAVAATLPNDEIDPEESPYRVPLAHNEVSKEEREYVSEGRVDLQNDLESRAWRAAVLGLVFPLPLTFYAAYLCWRCIGRNNQNGKLWIACCVSTLWSLAAAIMLLWAVGGVVNAWAKLLPI